MERTPPCGTLKPYPYNMDSGHTQDTGFEIHSTEELCAINDEKLKTVKDSLQTLELRRAANKLSIINSRLPLELLGNIFHCIVPMKSNGTRIAHLCDKHCWKSALVISHVCSYWRTVSLSMPSLWIQCTPSSPEALKTYLDRSAGVPMTLNISFRLLNWECINLLLPHLPRARGLRVMLPWMDTPDNRYAIQEARKDLLGSLENLPPSLVHLTICGSWLHDDEMESRPIPWLTANVDKSRLPNLHHLYISGAIIYWNCGLLQNLRTLVLNELDYLSPFSINYLLQILEACPEIEKIGISKMHWTNSSINDLTSKQPISLPRLRFAFLHVGTSDAVLHILNRLSFPDEANVWIETHVAIDESTLLDAAMFALCRGDKPLRQLGIACHKKQAGFYGSLLGSTGSFCLNAGRWKGTPSMAVQVVDQLLDRDLPSLTALEIQLEGTKTTSIHWWRRIFRRIPQLRILAVRVEFKTKNPFHALQTADSNSKKRSRGKKTGPPSAPGGSNPSLLLLPNLTELFLWDSDFVEINHDRMWSPKRSVDDPASPAYHLKKYLESHKNYGHHLEKLTIRTNTQIRESKYAFLEGLVRLFSDHPSSYQPFGLYPRLGLDNGFVGYY